MLGLKDKVSNKLSRLFSDSRNNSSPSSPPSSSAADNFQARHVSGGGKSVSSYFSFMLPSLSGDDSRQQDVYSTRYHECNTISEDEELQKLSLDNIGSTAVSKEKQTLKYHDGNEDGTIGRSSSDSDVFEEAHDQRTPRNPLPLLMDESSFISSELYEFLESSIPNIVKGCRWFLLYSTLKHGISLRTLLRKSVDVTGPCLLVAGDREGAVFGGLLDCPLKPTAKRKYQGTIQSFVFTTLYGEPRLFRPTGANRYYYLCMDDLLALGGGGNFALRLDGDLLNGTSGPCETFGNFCLAHSPEFELKNVELWGFTHSSRYLS